MSNGEWYLRHRDKVEYGPFDLAAIIEAAKQGNIATDTEVRHAKHTRGAWVLATRIALIREALNGQSDPVQPPVIEPQPATVVSAVTSEPFEFESVRTSPGIRRNQEFRVPKDLTTAAMAIFDFRFRYYITPWIIRIQWAICVVTVMLMLAVSGFSLVVSPIIDSVSSNSSSASDSGYSSPFPRSPAPTRSPSPLIWLGKLASGLTAKILSMIFLFGFAISVLLFIRMTLESVIVVFRIAEDAGEIRSALVERSRA